MNSEEEARKLLFKYNEDKILNEVYEYIKGTYNEHYASGDKSHTIDSSISSSIRSW